MKWLAVFLPLLAVGVIYTNCDSSDAFDLVGYEVKVDLDSSYVYQANDPGSSSLCVQVELPVQYPAQEIEEALLAELQAQVPQRSQDFIEDNMGVSLSDLVVSSGNCALELRDSFVCGPKSLGEAIPVEHSYLIYTYDGLASGTRLLFLEDFCRRL